MESTKLTAFQLRAARTAVRMSIIELSSVVRISKSTLIRIEKTDDFDYLKCHPSNLKLLNDFYKSKGVEFLGTQAIYLMTQEEKNKFRK